MIVKMEVKWADQKTLMIHFIGPRPNIRGGEAFSTFVKKLEGILNCSLQGVRIVLSPKSLKNPSIYQMNWSRFDAVSFRLRDFIKE